MSLLSQIALDLDGSGICSQCGHDVDRHLTGEDMIACAECGENGHPCVVRHVWRLPVEWDRP